MSGKIDFITNSSHVTDFFPDEFYNLEDAEIVIGRQRRGDKYRTKKRAGDTAEIPGQLAIITDPSYQNAMSMYQEGKAYLQPIDPIKAKGLDIIDDTIFFEGMPMSKAKLRSIYSDEVPDNIDLSFLRLCFSIILLNFSITCQRNKSINEIVHVYYPALAKAIGYSGNINRTNELTFINKILSFQTLLGVIEKGMDIQPVLIYAGEDPERNIIKFASPYLTRVIQMIYGLDVRKDNPTQPLIRGGANSRFKNIVSGRVSSDIVKEKNKTAVENVMIILSVIEGSRSYRPKISIDEIIRKNIQLKKSLEGKKAKDKNIILKRCFKKTWELLRTKTNIQQVYKGINLPEPDDSNVIPTSTTTNMIITFSHGGKLTNSSIS